jgi:hypothetical protein
MMDLRIMINNNNQYQYTRIMKQYFIGNFETY